jgi:hypothetical protein
MSKQLEGIEPKDIIKTITGTITKLWEPKTFNGDKGEYTMQGGDIEIDGTTYGLKLINNPQDQSIKGKKVTISSTRSKHGLNGVTLDHENYTGKNGVVDRDVIKVTKTGKVEVEGQTSAPKPAKQSVVQTIVNDNADVQVQLDRLVEQHMYINALVRTAYAKYNYEEETIRSYVSSIYIEANKKGLAYNKPNEEVKSEEPIDPADWGSMVVPTGHPKFKELGGKKLAEVGKPALVRLHQYFLDNPSDKPIAKAVEQAAEDLQLGGTEEVEELQQDDIPW